jgi:NADH:ubiquinone oxidoreductase subunit 6 (subunit J)
MSDELLDENVVQSIKARRNVYRIAALIATLIFLVCAYISMVPGMHPRDQLLLIASAAIVLIAALIVGSWGGRTRKAPLTRWPLDPVIGAILICELVECVFGISKVLPLIFR